MVCVACGWSEYDGALFCSKCTSPLYEKKRPAATDGPPPKPASVLPGQRVGRDTPPPQRIIFVFMDSRQRVTLRLQNHILIGRSDPAGGYAPDLDLEDYEGARSGVSRRHALVELNHLGVVITDLGSTNGTRLNDFDLPPDLPYALNNGDELYFGHLLAHIFFE
jgi:pSer/pThr/pTyr-binding forkhead associated (FHA) protein